MKQEIGDAKVFKKLEIYDSLVDIISSNEIKNDNDKFIKISKKETLSLAHDYFSDNPSYYSIFSSSIIKFKNNYYSSFFHKSQKVIIDYTKTLEDLFALVHELTHKVLYKDNQEDIYVLFNELLAFYSELELCNYLQNSDLSKEANKQVHKSLYYTYMLSKDANLESRVHKLIALNQKFDSEVSNYYVNDRPLYSEAGLDKFGKYLFATLMGIYINENISKKDAYKLKKALMSLDFNDIKSILQLDINFEDGLYIEENGIKEISKTYKKGIKKYE